MDLRGFFDTVRRSWSLVCAALLLGVLVGVGLSLTTTPKFVSTSRVFLATPGWNAAVEVDGDEASPYRGDDFSRQRALSYVRLAADRDLARRVIDKLGEHLSAARLSAETSAHVLPDTVVIDVSVTDASAARAKRLADAVTTEFCTEIRGLETPDGSLIPTVEPVVTQTANMPAHPVQPAIGTNIVLGATLGLLAGVSIAVLRRARAAVIGRGDPVSDIARRPALGFVPLLGADAAITSLDALGRGADHVRALRASVAVGYRGVPHDVLVVTATGSEDGHHQVARALALALAETGNRTALVDADLRGARAGGEGGLTAVVAGHVGLSEAMEFSGMSGVSYLRTGDVPDNPSPLLHSWRMRTTLEQLRASCDAVILLAPPASPYDDCRALAAGADGVLVVVAENVTHTADLGATMDALEVLDVPVFGIVVNYAPPRTALGVETSRERSS